MFGNNLRHLFLSGLFIIISVAFSNAQTREGANLRAKPLVMQKKPEINPEQARAEQLVKSLPEDRQKTFKAVSSIMAGQLIGNLASSKSDRRKEDDARQILAAAMDKTALITNAADAETLIQNTMSAAIYGIEADLKQLAAQISANNHIKEILREEITALRDILADWTDAGSVQEITYRECTKLKDGSFEIEEKTRVMSREQVEALIEDMESQLTSLSGTNEMDNMKLQDAMNKQAQIMQMMSNIMKNMHDTAKAIIDNMK